MIPATETPVTFRTDSADIPRTTVNVIDAAIAALKLAAIILLLLIGFVTSIEIVNFMIGGAGVLLILKA